VDEVVDVTGYDAFVIGSAAYMYHWLKEADTFVARHRSILSSRPVWLFSGGPVGADVVDEEGHDLVEVSRPSEIEELAGALHPRGDRVFFETADPHAPALGLGERFLHTLPAPRTAQPGDDVPDWAAADGWAAEIAADLDELAVH
jgi:menaquinone-dependent protoporphyrinogen oxidase